MTETQALDAWNVRAGQLQQQEPENPGVTRAELILEIQRLNAEKNVLQIERDMARNDLAIIRKNISRMVTVCK